MATILTATAYRTKAATISTAAVAITAAAWGWTANDVETADRATITAWTNGVALTWDGTTPTSTLGMALTASSTVTVDGNANVRNIRLIRSGGGDATVSITLEKF